MFHTQGLIAVLILALINAKTAVTENDYYPGMHACCWLSFASWLSNSPHLHCTLFCYQLIWVPSVK